MSIEEKKKVILDYLKFREVFQKEESDRMKQRYKEMGGVFSWVGATDESILDKFISQICGHEVIQRRTGGLFCVQCNEQIEHDSIQLEE